MNTAHAWVIALRCLPPFTLVIISMILLAGCADVNDNGSVEPVPDTGDYVLTPTYDSIRSSPGGGGLFLILIQPDNAFQGTIRLKLECDPALTPVLSTTTATGSDSTVEVVFAPVSTITPGRYPVTLVATHGNKERRIGLHVDVLEWEPVIADESLAKRDEFRDRLVAKNAAYAEIFRTPIRLYCTYPQVLIVEHYTELTEQYECRFCFHVMVPPHDWSMMRIRQRRAASPDLVLKRESDGTIHELPAEDYPTLFGY